LTALLASLVFAPEKSVQVATGSADCLFEHSPPVLRRSCILLI
jgi:hypothetical protein